MIKYCAKRVGMSACMMIFIIIILFSLLQLMPGSPFNNERLTDAQRLIIEEKYGLNEPVLVQIVTYVKNMMTGDFGVSYAIQQDYPIADMIATKYPLSVRIGLQAYVVGVSLGLIFGIIAALNHNTWIDTGATVFSMIGASIPSHVLALGFAYFLAYKMGWFPLIYSSNQPFLSTILPSLALSIGPMATTARFARNEMVEVLNSEYMLLAQTKGIRNLRIIIVHGVKNTLVPLITTMAPILMGLLTGSTVAEQIFGIPGIGSLFIKAIQTNDYNVVVSIAFLYSSIYVGLVLMIDILYGLIDPRIRLSGGGKNGK
ncbi:MAG: ABC transporter permease [Clostridia bacterium]